MPLRRWICWCLIAWSWTAVLTVRYRDRISSRRSSAELGLEMPPTRSLRLTHAAVAVAVVGALYAFGLSRRGRTWLRLGSRLSAPARHGEAYLQAFALRLVLSALWVLAGGWVVAYWSAAHPRASVSAMDRFFALWVLVAYGTEAVAVGYGFVRCRSLRVPLAEWGWLPGRGLWRELALGVLAGSALGVAAHFSRAGGATLFSSPWFRGFATVLWAPLIEETLYRGALYRSLRDRWQWPAAVAVTTVIFAAMHLPVWRWPCALVYGAVFALLREWRGTLFAAFTAHAVLNLSAVVW